MKVNDLMVGDYLCINRDNLCIKKDTIVEVRGIDANNTFESHIGCAICRPLDDMQYEGGIWCDYLDPIPLTPEILENNGFKRVDNGDEIHIIGEYVWSDEGKRNFTTVRITCYKGLNSGVNMLTQLETDCSHESGINMIHSCDIEYVHELQHCLKLVGINKEIIL